MTLYICLCLTSVQFIHSVVWLFVTPWSTAHQVSLPIITPRACSNSCPSSWWCHPNILSDLFRFIWQSLGPSVLLKMALFCSLLWMNNIPLRVFVCVGVYIYIYTHIHFCPWILGCFHVLVIVNGAGIKIGAHVSFQIMVFSRYMARNGTCWITWWF